MRIAFSPHMAAFASCDIVVRRTPHLYATACRLIIFVGDRFVFEKCDVKWTPPRLTFGGESLTQCDCDWGCDAWRWRVPWRLHCACATIKVFAASQTASTRTKPPSLLLSRLRNGDSISSYISLSCSSSSSPSPSCAQLHFTLRAVIRRLPSLLTVLPALRRTCVACVWRSPLPHDPAAKKE